MASFDEHVLQAESNLKSLELFNGNDQICIGWQITACYYSSLHYIHAFLSKHDIHPTNHNLLKDYIHPKSRVTKARLETELYANYCHLEMLSRKARYLCGSSKGSNERAIYANKKDLDRSIKYLDKIMEFSENKNGVKHEPIKLNLEDSKYFKGLKFIKIKSPVVIV